jgi:ribosome modulation factor
MSDTHEYRRGWAEGYKAAKDSLQFMLRREFSKGYQAGMEDEQQAHAEAEGGDDG